MWDCFVHSRSVESSAGATPIANSARLYRLYNDPSVASRYDGNLARPHCVLRRYLMRNYKLGPVSSSRA